MASSIANTHRVAEPTLVPMEGWDPALMVRCDPETKNVDVIHAFGLVLGEQTAARTVNKFLTKLEKEPAHQAGSSGSAIDIAKFTRVRWNGVGGRESIVAPLHVIVQALMMVNSEKTKNVRSTAAKTTLRVAGGDKSLIPQIQEANAAIAGTVQQQVLLNDTAPATESEPALEAPAATGTALLGMAPAPAAAANNHHVVSSRGDVNINVGAPAAAPSSALVNTGDHSIKDMELKALPVTGLASEVESVRDIPGISEEMKNALIESRLGVVLAVNNSIKSIAVSQANKAKHTEEIEQLRKRQEAQVVEKAEVETEAARSRKRHQEEMDEQNKKHKGVMDELAQLGESATLLRNNGGMTATASRALTARVLSSAELGAEVQASDDHVLQGVVQQATGLRTAKEHQELRTGVAVRDRDKLDKLRKAVLRVYKMTTGEEPNGAHKKTERFGRSTKLVDAYPTSWLEGQGALFARFA